MPNEQKRYFIELQPENVPALRSQETAHRREQAAHFIATIHGWLKENELEKKVSNLAMTALGQVQITCEAEIISKIHQHEEMSIATIRQGAMYVEGISKWAQSENDAKQVLHSVSG